MAQPSITTYFNTRKRVASESLIGARHKLMRIDPDEEKLHPETDHVNIANQHTTYHRDQIKRTAEERPQEPKTKLTQTNGIFSKARINGSNKKLKFSDEKTTEDILPKKVPIRALLTSTDKALGLLQSTKLGDKLTLSNAERGLQTPTKEEQEAKIAEERRNDERKKLTLDEIKKKLGKSSKLADLKASLNKLNQLEQTRNAIIQKNVKVATPTKSATVTEAPGSALKQFQSIDLEVLTSPKKGLSTPTKVQVTDSPTTVDTNQLMSPKKTIPRQLFSPTKSAPAYKLFQDLADSNPRSLPLPYKYRCLTEIFKSLDSVCAMFFNRKETITMKKLKPAVQRMLRKNFTETHLAQISHLYPEAFNFYQRKMLNAGSHTKYDYYQLVIVPNIKNNNKTADGNSSVKIDDSMMNPQVIIKRQQEFIDRLLDVVKTEHEKFLQTLDPPMNIPRNKLTRWHPEFDLHQCPDIKRATLPQPPNVEKFSSAKDVLSTARNLFNSTTVPNDRVPEPPKEIKTNTDDTDESDKPDTPIDSVLKNIPKSLLEKIRAKQAAKAMEKMTRRPSQDQEANKYGKLPDLAKYLRNIFVTEGKNVLELDLVLERMSNSYREKMPKNELKNLLDLLANEAPNKWLTFHYIRKTDYVKIARDANLADVLTCLQNKFVEKSK